MLEFFSRLNRKTSESETHDHSWWRHQMETCSALLTLCAGNSPVTGEFPSQRSVTRSFYVFFDLRLNKRLGKQSWRRCIETLSHSLWRHFDVGLRHTSVKTFHFNGQSAVSSKAYPDQNQRIHHRSALLVLFWGNQPVTRWSYNPEQQGAKVISCR